MQESDQPTLAGDLTEIVLATAFVVLPWLLFGTPTLLMLIGLLWVMAMIRAVIEARRGLRRRERGMCLTCGYNLTGNVSGICPECGTRVPENRADSSRTEP